MVEKLEKCLLNGGHYVVLGMDFVKLLASAYCRGMFIRTQYIDNLMCGKIVSLCPLLDGHFCDLSTG
ncbi:hypothetical protein D3C76_1306530 [compost metagenome]